MELKNGNLHSCKEIIVLSGMVDLCYSCGYLVHGILSVFNGDFRRVSFTVF